MYFSLMNLFLSNVSGWLLWIVSALLHSLFMLGQRERVRGLVEMVPENPNEMWHIYCPLTFFFFFFRNKNQTKSKSPSVGMYTAPRETMPLT